VVETVVSKNGIPIRLTDERWLHITEEPQNSLVIASKCLKQFVNRNASLPGTPLSFLERKLKRMAKRSW
jgi:hypothetical protein